MVKRVKLRQRAKFRGDRSNHRRHMAIFRLFMMAVAAIMDFHNFLKFLTVGRLKKSRTASPCRISSKSVKLRPRYGDFSIFQVGFSKIYIFNGRAAQGGRNASPRQIWLKSVKTRLRYGDFSNFPDGGRPPSWICYVSDWTCLLYTSPSPRD